MKNAASENKIYKIYKSTIKDKSKEKINKTIINEEQKKFKENEVKECLCKIKYKGNNKIELNGFLCKIPFPNKYNLLPVLITNDKILENIKNNNPIEIIVYIMNEDKPSFKINFKNSLKFYQSEKYNIAIIEIKNKNAKFNHFLDIDNNIFENKNYNFESICLINNKNSYSGEIKKIKENKNDFYFNYTCNEYQNEEEFLGSPILNSDNYKIIGIYIRKQKNIIYGKIIKEPIEEFCNKYLTYKLNEIQLLYQYPENEDDKIRIFGDIFVDNNKNLCTIVVNGKKQKLHRFYSIEKDKLKNNNNIFEITLKDIDKISDFSNMFCFCYNLILISNFNLNDTSKIQNLSNMFCGCESLESLPDISYFDTSNVTDLSGIFSGCSLIKYLPNISHWNIKKVKDLSNLFSGCSSLIKIPDISKWNTSNTTNMNNLFSQCNSLTSIPDISKWKTSKVSNMNNMFSECTKLTNIADISNWDISNVTNITRMFYKCNSLEKLPDISKWNTDNIKHMNSLFEECSSLKSLPNISKWNTFQVTSMFCLFSGCSSLISLPDISLWNTRHVEDMCRMFCDCTSLKSLPNISKWITTNLRDKEDMFSGCNSGLKIPAKFK